MTRRFRNAIGPAVRRRRMQRGWTQDQLAARLQLEGLESADRVYVAKIESQIRSVFDYELAVIAHVLGTEPGSLLPKIGKLKPNLEALIRGARKG